jgi:hypothetical protein
MKPRQTKLKRAGDYNRSPALVLALPSVEKRNKSLLNMDDCACASKAAIPGGGMEVAA